jgi:hypothetical protein
MSTLGAMKSRIASEIARSNLTTQIAAAITTAITTYQKERFRFNEAIPLAPVTFSTIAGQPYYSAVLPSAPLVTSLQTMQKIDYLNILIGNTVQELNRLQPEEIRLLNFANTQSGQPLSYAIEGETVMLYPTPSAAWVITIGGFFAYPAPVDDAETGNRWMTDGELLIRSRAKFEIATHVTRNRAMAEDMSPDPPPPGKGTGHATYRAWKDLKGEANRFTTMGRIRATQF